MPRQNNTAFIIKLAEGRYIPHIKLINELTPEMTIIADCEAYISNENNDLLEDVEDIGDI